MYFWDNTSNAYYWLKEKKRKEPTVEAWQVVSANISLNKMLDLTDEKLIEGYDRIWQNYCNRREESYNQPLGIKLNKLFDFCLSNHYNVIKGVGYYSSIPKISFLIGSNLMNSIKIIYCVKNNEAILDRFYCEESA